MLNQLITWVRQNYFSRLDMGAGVLDVRYYTRALVDAALALKANLSGAVFTGDVRLPLGGNLYVGGPTPTGTDGVRLHSVGDDAYIDAKGGGSFHFRGNDTDGGTERGSYNLTTGAWAFSRYGAWVNATYTTGWVDHGGGFLGARYRKVGDIVYLEGLCKRTSGVSTTMFVLPAGYLPPSQVLFVVLSGDALGRVDIDPSGNVIVTTGLPANWVNLTGIFFSVL